MRKHIISFLLTLLVFALVAGYVYLVYLYDAIPLIIVVIVCVFLIVYKLILENVRWKE